MFSFYKSKKLHAKPVTPTRAVLQCENLESRLLLATAVASVAVLPPVGLANVGSLSVNDASQDDTPLTAMAGGAIHVSYTLPTPVLANPGTLATAVAVPFIGHNPPPPPTGGSGPTSNPVDHVTIEAWQGTTKVADVGTFYDVAVSNGLINLAAAPQLAGGSYTFKAHAFFKNGATAYVVGNNLAIKNGTHIVSSFTGDTFDLTGTTGDGIVFRGGGGTDTLNLNVDQKMVASIDGMTLTNFSPTAGGQALYQGLAVDYIRLTDGREIYFTGMENLELLMPMQSKTAAQFVVVGTPPMTPQEVPYIIHLTQTPNDPSFKDQWNLQVTDVPDAWRFTKGNGSILLVSLDTGVLPDNSSQHLTGINSNRLITNDDSVDEQSGFGHGHSSISIMIGTPNDGQFQTGINWVSLVYVTNVHKDDLQSDISDALDYANAHGMKAVFQGGIQGDYWLTDGGDQSDLENLISRYADNALFAIAAGNGGPTGNLNDPNFMTSVSGVAKLEFTHGNVMSVGALQHTPETVNGLANASDVNLAPYSNRGFNLTMVAPTDSLTTDFDSMTQGVISFNGTSCANPNLAAMASLVWSANPNLTSFQVRTILQRTAMDLGDTGFDATFGSGLVDTGEAVRRAVAYSRDYALADMYYQPQFSVTIAAGSTAQNVVVTATTSQKAAAANPTTMPAAPERSALVATLHTPQVTQVDAASFPVTLNRTALEAAFAGHDSLVSVTNAPTLDRVLGPSSAATDRAVTQFFATLAKGQEMHKADFANVFADVLGEGNLERGLNA